MKLLGNSNLKNRVKLSFLLILFINFFLIWNPSNDLCISSKYLEMRYEHEVLLNKCNNRLLSKHEIQKDRKYPELRNKLPDDVNNMNIRYTMNNISTHYQLNKKKLNDLDAYKKGYMNRYSKKRGLAKLDCYYERKLFDKFDKIYDLSRSMKNDKKNFKKYIYNKFGYCLILFAISPIFGIILPALFFGNGPFSNFCPSDCEANGSDPHDHKGIASYYKSQFSRAHWDAFFYINRIFSFTLIIIVLTVIIYTLVKVVKYERLKAGKGNIKGKEYYRFCKNLFI